MADQTKKTVMAIVREVTEGTPVKPTAGSDYIALQEGFEIEPAFEELDNVEFTGSIGTAKKILGSESPTVTLSHYIRHSGVEGQAPDFSLLLEGAFGGFVAAGTERDVVSATAGTATAAATITVDTGEGVEFERGEALLIKDGTNGFEIRNVLSIAGDVLTLSTNLANAPGAGVNLGRAVLYKAGEDHPSLSIWNFRGNGTAQELIAGGKVSELSMEANAGELINGSFTINGIEFFFNPIDQITASNNLVDFTDDSGTFQATITPGFFKDPHDLAAAIETSMNDVAGDAITVTYDDVTGKYTIASDGAVTFSLLWDTGGGAANTIGDVLGFDTSADDTGAFTYTSDSAVDLTSFQTATFDDSDPLAAKANEVFIGDFADTLCFEASTMSATISNGPVDIPSICADSGKSGSVMTSREVTIEVTAVLEKFESDKFKRFRTNEKTLFAYNFGTKVGGDWVAGKSGNLYIPTATISSFKVGDNDGIIMLEMTLTAFVDNGLGEVFMNFL